MCLSCNELTAPLALGACSCVGSPSLGVAVVVIHMKVNNFDY